MTDLRGRVRMSWGDADGRCTGCGGTGLFAGEPCGECQGTGTVDYAEVTR